MKNTWIRMMKNESLIDYRYNLFCLPYAGGGTSIFYQWQSMLTNAGIRVCPILLPGREHRMNEVLIDNAYELSNQIYKGIQEELNRPFLIFGHSMGGIIAYELSRLIYEKEKKVPEILFLSGTELQEHPNKNPRYKSDDKEFIEHLIESGGTDPAIAKGEIFKQFFLPTVRNDYKLVETYAFQGEKLNTKVCIYFSKQDNMVHYKDTLSLKKVSDDFEFVEFRGDHFFVNTEHIGICRNICKQVEKQG